MDDRKPLSKEVKGKWLSLFVRHPFLKIVWKLWTLAGALCFVAAGIMQYTGWFSGSGHAAEMPVEISDLLVWMKMHGTKIHPCVSVQRCGSGGGRCVMASCGVEKGELLLSVPRIVQLTPQEPAPPCPELKDWLDLPSAEGGAKEWHLSLEALELALRLLQERKKGSKSVWHLYLPTIPTDFPPAMMDDDAQRRCLAETPGVPRMDRRLERQAMERKMLLKCQAAGASGPDDPLLRWAKHVVGSRAYESAGKKSAIKSGDAEAMVPFADLFNDSPDPNSEWTRSAETGLYEIKAAKDITEGAEFLISYGPKNNEQLLTHYGFTHEGNVHDAIYIDLVPEGESPLAWADARIALSLDPSSPAARTLPKALRSARQVLASRGGTGEALEVETLSLVRDHCVESADIWARGPPPEAGDDTCAGYHRGLAALAGACVSFARDALEQLGADPGPPPSQAVAAAENEAAKQLAKRMVEAWREDAKPRLPQRFGS